MSSESHVPKYYQEDYEYSLFHQEFNDFAEPNFSPPRLQNLYSAGHQKHVLPTINYFDERKCPIYRHNVKYDSSVYNNYDQKLSSPRRNAENPKITPQNASKFVLDKLEETYWATWKPKKENLPVKKKSPRKVPSLGPPEKKLQYKDHNKGNKKALNKPHGDVIDNIIKYFKAEEFESSSTAASVVPDKGGKKIGSSTTTVSAINENADKTVSKKILTRPQRIGKIHQKDSISQEIQTVVHYPVVLEQIEENIDANKEFQVIYEMEGEARDEESGDSGGKITNIEETNTVIDEKETTQTQKQQKKKNKEVDANKPEEKGKKRLKNKKSQNGSREKQSSEEIQNDSDSIHVFVDIKDSIDIAKEKLMKTPREHYQQPKCIRLFRKSGGTPSFIKGGTYPLRSCLKKESSAKGNFRLGAPGSPLFVTTSSFSNRKK